jgi:LuxR family maltose regulon positive regulatory protein
LKTAHRSSALAISKIHLPPRRNGLLRRPRLIDHLHSQIERQLVVMVAPAGYGKTSLLLDWAHAADCPVAWYTLDEFDNAPHTFLTYLIESIRVPFPKFGTPALAALEQSADTVTRLQPVIRLIANEMFHLSDHLVVVLDDYHVIENQAIGELIELLIRYAGDSCHLFINSRTLLHIQDQLLLRARNKMSGMGIAELRFTAPEIQALVEQNYGLTVSAHRAQELAQLTDGWITALLLMGQQTGWRELVQDTLAMPEAAKPVFDYLAEQVFSRQSERMRHFLLGSSVLNPLIPEMLDQLPGLADSKRYLETLREQPFFLTRLRGEEELYEYHPLLRAFLKTRLQKEDPTWFEQLRLACAEQYQQQGKWERAVEIYLELGETAKAAEALEGVAASLRKLSEIVSATRWVEQLPTGRTSRSPQLLSLRGKINMTRGLQAEAAVLFDASARLFARTGDYEAAADQRVWKGTTLRFLGRYQECIAESRKIDALLSKLPRRVSSARLRAASLHLRGLAKYRLGQLTQAYGDLKRGRDLYLTTDDLISQANVYNDLGITARAMGHLTQAIAQYQQALALWERLGIVSAAAHTLNNLGFAYLLQGKTEEADAVLQEALAKSRQGSWARIEAGILSTLGDLYRDLGEYPQALEFYRDCLSTAQEGNDAGLIFYSQLFTGDVYRRIGDVTRAREWLDQAARSMEAGKSAIELGQWKLAEGLLAAEQGRWKSGLKLISEAAKSFGQLENKQLEALAEYHLAHLLHSQGHTEEATTHLIRTAKLVDALGYDHFLVAEGRHTHVTLEFASTLNQVGPRFKRILHRAHPLPAPRLHRAPVASPASFLAVHTLGQEQFVVNGARVSELRPQVREVFLFLLSRWPTGARKEELADQFWSDLSPERADGVLGVTLTRIRKLLCPVSLVNGWYVLEPEHLWYDVLEFEKGFADAQRASSASLRIPRLKQTLDLYHGDYLERVESTWVIAERARLRQVYLSALITLAEAYAETDDLESALNTFQKASQAEPFFELAWLGAMQVYLRMGNRAASITHYEKLKRILQDELGIEPGPAMQALYRDIIDLKQ